MKKMTKVLVSVICVCVLFTIVNIVILKTIIEQGVVNGIKEAREVPITNTNLNTFKIGDKVKIVNIDHYYSTHSDMAEKMKLTMWSETSCGYEARKYFTGKIGIVVAIESYHSDCLIGVRLKNEEIIIGFKDLRLIN